MGFLVSNDPVWSMNISQLRFLAYSYLYYIKNKTLIPDYAYDNSAKWLYETMKKDEENARKTDYYELCKGLDDSGSGFYIKEEEYPDYVKMIAYKLERQKEEKREISLEQIEDEWKQVNTEGSDGMFDILNKEPVELWTDGSSSNNKTRCGGWSCVLVYKDKRKEIYGGEPPDETNQTMEMTGVIKGLEEIKTNNIPVHIYSDSAYIVNCMTNKWYEKWRMNGWINSKGEDVANKELWERMIELIDKQNYVKFCKVKGHSNIELNELADSLAVKGRYEIEKDLGLR